ncbi:MAG: dimethylmenaquinone methyltransferase [Actinobacteria bacterium]|nr:dimethylmenaquinone methyltransferase [Actinomycetota bacterium]
MTTHAELASELLKLGAATLGESGARAMRDRITPVWSGAEIAAPAYTVRCSPGDNLAVHVAVSHAPEDHALVVDVGDLRELGYWGEVLTTAAEARGITGLVIDGGVRDVRALKAHGFPVFATTVALRGATKDLPGAVNVPIRCGGVPVVRGDWVVGDADGVVVVPGAEIHPVLVAARDRADKEEGMFKALRKGTTTIRLLGLDPRLIRKGDH